MITPIVRGQCAFRRGLVFAAALFLAGASSGNLFSQEVQATEGFYRYKYSPAQTAENTGTTSLDFGTGMLTDGDTDTLVSWPGNGTGYTAQPIVFDLRRDVPVQRVVVHSRFPNQYWAIQSITVEVRASGDECYQPAAFVDQPGGNWTQLSISTRGIEGRYVRVVLKRAHNYVHMGVSEVQIYTAPTSLPLQAAIDLSTEFPRVTETLATAGYYRYLTSPAQESTTGGSLAFGDGMLTNGDTTTLASWAGGAAAPSTLPVVFDLQRDVPVQRVVVHSGFPNSYWTMQSVTVETRSSAEETYQNPVTIFLADTNWTVLDLPGDGRIGRYVRLTFKRNNPYLSLGVAEVKIYTSPSTAAFQATTDLGGELTRDTLLVDTYGQFLWDAWPGKIVGDAQLVAEKNAEEATLPVSAPADTDLYGGRTGTNHGATGYFRLQKISGRWWFVTPLGNSFFLHGLCETNPASWGYATAVRKIDKVTPRAVFQQLPSQTTYPAAYNSSSGHLRVNFPVANLCRKYGSSYAAPWAAVMQRRMWDWGFNAHGKWERLPTATLPVPFVVNLKPGSGLVRIQWAPDPFAAGFASAVESGVQGTLTGNATNPWMIGFVFDNEAGWDLNIIKSTIALPASREAKVALVDYLFSRHTAAQLSSAFGFTITAKADLLSAAPAWPASLNATGLGFISEVAGPVYWSTVNTICRQYDTHHLFLGGALVPGWRSSFEWETSALPYVDAISLDKYGKTFSWYTESGYAALDKPVVMLEYGLTTAGRGHGLFANGDCASHEERGKYWRHVIENLASHPNFVGASQFALFDQAPTGRAEGGGGENYNFGLLNQQDQPYAEMIAEVKKSRFPRLHDVHEGTVTPYSFNGESAAIPGDAPLGAYAFRIATTGLTDARNLLAQSVGGDGVMNPAAGGFRRTPTPSIRHLP